MNILIIGSKGFIGSYCVKYFSQNHTVWQCDVGVDYGLTRYTQVDATNANYYELFRQTPFDVCINCSGAASVPDSLAHPQRDFYLNAVNVFKQLDAIRKHNPNCKYVNLSSAAVYGNPQRLPINEEQPTNPISPYGIHKKMAETICKEFSDLYRLKTCSLRIFSAYGNGLQKQLFWDLHQKIEQEQALDLFGTGKESRDFIHVEDIVRAIDCVIHNSDFNSDIVNVANGKEETIRYVAERFYNYYGVNKPITFMGQNRPGDPINWQADITKLQTMGYKQSISMETGLKNYIAWLKER